MKANVVVDYRDCEPVLGFNTKQWWVYDNGNDMYIDPTIEALNEVKQFDSYDRQEQMMMSIINSNPDWLQDKEYWFDAEDTGI